VVEFFADPIIHVSSAAGIYSQVTGVLAGLAFTALIGFLGRRAGKTDDAVAASLALTLVALVIVAVLYAVLAGGPDESGPAYLGIMIYGASFALAILSMFHSIALLASMQPGLRWTLRITRFWTSVLGPAVAMLLVSSAAIDIFYLNCLGNSCPSTRTQLTPTKPFGLGLTLAAAIFIVSLYWLPRYTQRTGRRSRAGFLTAASMVAAIAAAVSAGAAIWLLMTPADFRPSEALQDAVIAVAAAAIGLFAFFAARARPPLDPPTASAGAPVSGDDLATAGAGRHAAGDD